MSAKKQTLQEIAAVKKTWQTQQIKASRHEYNLKHMIKENIVLISAGFIGLFVISWRLEGMPKFKKRLKKTVRILFLSSMGGIHSKLFKSLTL